MSDDASALVGEVEQPVGDTSQTYVDLHKLAGDFATRSDYLDHELQIMKPRRNALNLPGRDFRFELEDLVPAFAGTIGIIAMYTAVMTSWAEGLNALWVKDGIDRALDVSALAIEVSRVEMLIPALLFCVFASGLWNPRANLAGNHGPMIPAASAKRPIPGGAILLGSLVMRIAVLGTPMDVAVWPPVMRVALLVGVALPLLEAGMQMIKDDKDSKAAGICVFAALATNPVLAWAMTMLLDNNGLIGDKERPRRLSKLDRTIIPATVLTVCLFAMLAVGMLEDKFGIPALL